MDIYDKSLITILVVSLLLIVVAIPLVLHKVPRNTVYGFRTRSTMASDDLWYAANAHFGKRLIIASACGCVLAIITYHYFRPAPQAAVSVSVLFLVLPSLIAALATRRLVRKYSTSASGR